MRYILHCDLNNFYASVESLYDPSIRNKAVAVVGDQDKRHGIVLARNYIAKKYGVRTGDTIWEAKVKMQGKEIVTVNANFDRYSKMSKMIKDVYREYSDQVESFGIDEAWIDISHKAKSWKEAFNIGEELRERIVREYGITISVGVSFNKIFAKIGSDYKKPNATTLITPDNFKDIVWKLPCNDLIYVGRSTHQKLTKIGVKTIGDLANTDPQTLIKLLGKNGKTIYEFANGLENNPVKKEYQPEKSIGNSTTCPRDLTTVEEVETIIYMLAESVVARMRKKNYHAKVVTLYVKDNTLASFERQITLEFPTNLVSEIGKQCMMLFDQYYIWEHTVRALGVRVSKFEDCNNQYNLFRNENQVVKQEKMEKTVENLRSRFGYEIIKRGNVMKDIDFLQMNTSGTRHKIHPISFFKL